MKTLTLKITAEDIAQGKTYDGKNCPIACALKRRGFTVIWVCPAYIDLADKNGNLFHAATSTKASKFMRAFDNLTPVEPTVLRFKITKG